MTARRLNSVQEYYFSKKLREVAAMVAAGKPVINMGIGSPDLPAHPEVVSALKDSFNHPKVHQYQSYQGLPELRSAIADFYLKHYHVTADPSSEILPLMGSKEGIMHISMAFLNPGDKVLIPNPGYPTYESVTKLLEAKPIFYDLSATNNWQP
ncbi:MAG: aminotransferase class I/II-fold pyridoxal phosphate-dependent enzyme, partial [Flavobacteriaceae bacterium]